jgi:hypothetical protein
LTVNENKVEFVKIAGNVNGDLKTEMLKYK